MGNLDLNSMTLIRLMTNIYSILKKIRSYSQDLDGLVSRQSMRLRKHINILGTAQRFEYVITTY